MTARGVVRRGQLAAERLMIDRVLIERPGDLDPVTGERSWSTVYDGRGKVQTYEPYESTIASQTGHTYVTQRYSVHVPVDAGQFDIGDRVTITRGIGPVEKGIQYRVAGLHEKTFQTAQRLLVDQEVSPSGD